MTRVLVVRLDSLGDVLLCGPAVRAVAAHADEVWMLCSDQGAPAARMLPGVDRVLTWECPWIVADPAPIDAADLDAVVRLISDAHIDEAVILTSFHQSPLPTALLLRLAGIRRISGASVDHPGSLLDVRLTPGETLPEEIPEPERALAIAGAAGFDLPVGDEGALAVTAVGAGPDELRGCVVVHPGASAPSRRWPAERFARTVALLVAEGWRVAVTGASSEQALTREVAHAGGVDLGGLLDLPALAAVIASAAVVVCGNTGPAHVAAAVGTPVVSLFSPVVSATKWAPYCVPCVLLGDQRAACRGTRARECPVPGHPCLASITPEDVVVACRQLDAVGQGVRA
jgi:ADP-heptose:LPS heptosyltransferase